MLHYSLFERFFFYFNLSLRFKFLFPVICVGSMSDVLCVSPPSQSKKLALPTNKLQTAAPNTAAGTEEELSRTMNGGGQPGPDTRALETDQETLAPNSE